MEVSRVLSNNYVARGALSLLKGNPRVPGSMGAGVNSQTKSILPESVSTTRELLNVSNIFPIFLNTVVKRMQTKQN